VSYGIACTGSGPGGLDAAVISADAALYQAKTLGRDRAELATGNGPTK
jgi:PleD family two-component response regulator